ncbi:MAG: hypothetical protein ABIE14_05455 [Patescibacteria group bacterium]
MPGLLGLNTRALKAKLTEMLEELGFDLSEGNEFRKNWKRIRDIRNKVLAEKAKAEKAEETKKRLEGFRF